MELFIITRCNVMIESSICPEIHIYNHVWRIWPQFSRVIINFLTSPNGIRSFFLFTYAQHSTKLLHVPSYCWSLSITLCVFTMNPKINILAIRLVKYFSLQSKLPSFIYSPLILKSADNTIVNFIISYLRSIYILDM